MKIVACDVGGIVAEIHVLARVLGFCRIISRGVGCVRFCGRRNAAGVCGKHDFVAPASETVGNGSVQRIRKPGDKRGYRNISGDVVYVYAVYDPLSFLDSVENTGVEAVAFIRLFGLDYVADICNAYYPVFRKDVRERSGNEYSENEYRENAGKDFVVHIALRFAARRRLFASARFIFRAALYYEEKNHEHVHYASENDEQMEYRMYVSSAALLPEKVEHGADGVEYSAADEKYASPYSDCKVCQLRAEHDHPPHSEIAYHREALEHCKVDRIESDSESGKPPDYAENGPSDPRFLRAERAERDRSVRSRDEKKYRAVIDHLKYFFRFETRAETVVYARHGVQYHHRGTVY